jgi:hypothetical protein
MAGWRDRAVKVEAGPSAPAKSSWRDRATPIEPPAAEPDEPEALSRATEAPPERVPDDPGLGATIGHGFLEGVFKGGTDELMGAFTAAPEMHPLADPSDVAAHQKRMEGSTVGWRQPDGSVKLLKGKGDLYRAGRDTEREVQKGAWEHHPKALIASQIAGDLASDAALKWLGVPVDSPIYQTAAGALTGFLSGDAELTGDKPELGKAALQTGIGGGLGYAAPKVGAWAGRGLRKAAPVLKQFAEERAAKALGRDWKKVLESFGPERLREIGRDMLDSKVVRFGGGSDATAKRLEELTKERGHALGEVIDTLDEATPKSDRLDVAGVVDQLRAKLTRDVAPAQKGVADTIAGELDKYGQMAVPFADRAAREGADIIYKPTVSIREAEELLKRPAQAAAKSGQKVGTPGSTTEGLQEMAREIKRAIETHADVLAQRQSPELVGELRRAKDAYGRAAEGLSVAGKQGQRDLINNFVTPTDYGAAMSGAAAAGQSAASGGITGLLTAAAHHLAKKRGASAVAVGADRAADLARWVHRLIPGTSPEEAAFIGQYLSRELLRDTVEIAQPELAR